MLEALQIPFTAGVLVMAADLVRCDVPRSPQIYVRPKAYPTKFNHNRTIADLSAKDTDTISPYPSHAVTQTGGITESKIELTMNMQFKVQSYPSLGVGCIFFDRIDVVLQIDPTVYIAKDYKRRSCKYREVLEHELKHVRVDKQIANKYARRMGEALRLSINDKPGRGPYPVDRLPEIQNAMQEYVGSVIKTQQSLLEEDRFRQQQAIDTFEEYERIRKACN